MIIYYLITNTWKRINITANDGCFWNVKVTADVFWDKKKFICTKILKPIELKSLFYFT